MKIRKMTKEQIIRRIEKLERRRDKSLYLSHLRRRLKNLS
jgi:hypothetical protein